MVVQHRLGASDYTSAAGSSGPAESNRWLKDHKLEANKGSDSWERSYTLLGFEVTVRVLEARKRGFTRGANSKALCHAVFLLLFGASWARAVDLNGERALGILDCVSDLPLAIRIPRFGALASPLRHLPLRHDVVALVAAYGAALLEEFCVISGVMTISGIGGRYGFIRCLGS